MKNFVTVLMKIKVLLNERTELRTQSTSWREKQTRKCKSNINFVSWAEREQFYFFVGFLLDSYFHPRGRVIEVVDMIKQEVYCFEVNKIKAKVTLPRANVTKKGLKLF